MQKLEVEVVRNAKESIILYFACSNRYSVFSNYITVLFIARSSYKVLISVNIQLKLVNKDEKFAILVDGKAIN